MGFLKNIQYKTGMAEKVGLKNRNSATRLFNNGKYNNMVLVCMLKKFTIYLKSRFMSLVYCKFWMITLTKASILLKILKVFYCKKLNLI